MYLSLSLSLSLYLSLSLFIFWSGQVSSSLWSNVSKATSLWVHSLNLVKTLFVILVRQTNQPRGRQGHLLSCSGQLKTSSQMEFKLQWVDGFDLRVGLGIYSTLYGAKNRIWWKKTLECARVAYLWRNRANWAIFSPWPTKKTFLLTEGQFILLPSRASWQL